MKIVYIASSIIPSQSANSVHVMKMCSALARLGNEVILLVPDAVNEMQEGINDVYAYYDVDENFEIQYINWPRIKGKGIIFAISAARRAVRLKPDFIYGRNISACYFSSVFGKVPVGYESHSPVKNEGRLLEYFFRRMLVKKHFMFLAVITRSLEKYYLETYAISKRKIVVLPDASDPVCEKIALPIENNGSSKKLRIGYIGSFHKGKGIETLIQLISQYANAEYHIVGGNQKQVTEATSALSKIDNVKFYGFLSQKEAEKIRVSCDVLLAPYSSKVKSAGTLEIGKWMSPLKIFEYMAAGKAIIATDLPVLREVLNETNSILVKENDIRGWVSAIQRLQEPQMRQKIGEQAYMDFKENFTWDVRAKRLLDETTRT